MVALLSQTSLLHLILNIEEVVNNKADAFLYTDYTEGIIKLVIIPILESTTFVFSTLIALPICSIIPPIMPQKYNIVTKIPAPTVDIHVLQKILLRTKAKVKDII